MLSSMHDITQQKKLVGSIVFIFYFCLKLYFCFYMYEGFSFFVFFAFILMDMEDNSTIGTQFFVLLILLL